jgi:hypothetical protein
MPNLGILHTHSQPSLFPQCQPVVVANGVGVNSFALLIYMKRSDWRPDLILHADPGSEFPQTYDYIPVMKRALDRWGFPTITVVRYVPSNFKHWPPYYTLEEDCFTNGTLPSLAFGFKSCSQKWEVAPQNKYCESRSPAIECWQQGGRVLKLIGYDAGAAATTLGTQTIRDTSIATRSSRSAGIASAASRRSRERVGRFPTNPAAFSVLRFSRRKSKNCGESFATHCADGSKGQASTQQDRRPVATETPARWASRLDYGLHPRTAVTSR